MHQQGEEMARCTVARKCSSTGKACGRDDRACQSSAIAEGLEITCERSDTATYVYCPPGAAQRDGTIVWVLLVVAVMVATIGGVLSFVLLKKRLRS